MMDKVLDVWVDGTCSFKGVECFPGNYLSSMLTISGVC